MIVLSLGEEKKQAEEPQKIQATKMTKVKMLRLEVAETYHPNEFSAPSREYGKRFQKWFQQRRSKNKNDLLRTVIETEVLTLSTHFAFR